MACLHVKLCVVISERFRKCISYLKALFTNVLVYFTYFTTFTVYVTACDLEKSSSFNETGYNVSSPIRE